MPIGAQPPGRRGTVDQPYSALNLRLVLALFGFVVCTLLAIWLFRAGLTVPGWLLLAWAVVAVVDAVVVQFRRRARRRAEGTDTHSLFE
jgi:NhaP-type Na+/H+ or K+/H+ antiporter